MSRRRKRKTVKKKRLLQKDDNRTSTSVPSCDDVKPSNQAPGKEPQALQVKSDDTHHTNRNRLPVTRRSITHKFTVGEQEGYMTVGLFEDGRPGELFLTISKEGSTIGGLMDAIGILTSLALQYGVPVETLTKKLEYTRFEPSGWTHNEDIRQASSIVDYIFRWLGIQFSKSYRKQSLRHVPDICPKDSIPTSSDEHQKQNNVSQQV